MKRRSKNWDKSYYHRPNRARGWSPVVIIVSVLMHSPIIKVKRTKLRTDDRVRWGMRNRRRRCKGWMENNFAWVRSVERSFYLWSFVNFSIKVFSFILNGLTHFLIYSSWCMKLINKRYQRVRGRERQKSSPYRVHNVWSRFCQVSA